MYKRPGKINIHDFYYDLPDDKIARFPLEKRDSSKLLFYEKGNLTTKVFNELPSMLNSGYQLIFNDTRVIRARLIFTTEAGARIEIFLLEPFDPSGYEQSFSSRGVVSWICLIGNAKKWKSEYLIKDFNIKEKTVRVNIRKTERKDNAFIVLFSWDTADICFSEIVASAGKTPIPPYLKRDAIDDDLKWYQTVYSNFEGSVAAPTAGLHFSGEVFDGLKSRGIDKTMLTLHVGAGTFIPVKEDDATLHKMHSEQVFISRANIEKLLSQRKELIAVGTTSVRTLESLYWLGIKLKNKAPSENISVQQWDWLDMKGDMSVDDSLKSVIEYMDAGKLDIIHFSTGIMIVPGYDFRMIRGMITNFHQPGSTLLLLVAAFIGNDWKKVYEYAMKNDFRFLSYGDSSLLLK